MREKYRKKKEALYKLQRAKNDRMLKIFLVIFFLGYTFFFTSNYFMPKMYRNLDIANIGEVISMDEYILTLDTWDYSRSDKAFEIIFEVENLSVNEDLDYSFKCFTGDDIKLGKVYKKIGNLVVVRFDNVPGRWTDATLKIQIEDKETSLSMNDKEVNNVKAIKERNDEEYTKYALENKIFGMEKHLKALEDKKASLNETMEKTYEKLLQLEGITEFQTEEEKTITENNKSKLAREMESAKADQDEVLYQIESISGRVKAYKEQLKNL